MTVWQGTDPPNRGLHNRPGYVEVSVPLAKKTFDTRVWLRERIVMIPSGPYSWHEVKGKLFEMAIELAKGKKSH